MKIIELLNKIANGEEIPQKIKYLNRIYERIYEYKDTTYGTGYLYEDKGIKYWFSEDALSDSAEELNYEVEIIEDEKEIDIQSIEEIKEVFIENSSCGEDVKFLARKYNLILQAVKQLEKNIKELR